MPKYELLHDLLTPGARIVSAAAEADRKSYRAGDILWDTELTDAGFDLDHLRTPKGEFYQPAIKIVRGTEEFSDRSRAVQVAEDQTPLDVKTPDKK